MSDIKVSVCMVVYNHERYIAQAVESVLAQQTSFPIEIVIGEDCSTDDTRQILHGLAQREPDRIRLRFATRNQGPKLNFAGAFGDCRGQYVAMLEGDDYWTSRQKLQRQADALDGRPDWSICFHPARCVYEDGLQGPEFHPEHWERPEATLTDLLAINFIPTNAVMFRNHVFPALPPWFMKLKLGDWPLHILNAAYGNIGFLPEVMSAYRVHANGMWSSQDLGAKLTSVFEMLTAVDHHFSGKYSAIIDNYRLTTVQWMADLLKDRDETGSRLIALHAAHEAVHLRAERMAAEILNRSLSHKVVRETVRPIKQLWHGARSVWSRYEARKKPVDRPPSKVA